MPRDAAFTQALCADEQGFSLHAALRCAADKRQRLEQLRRYITRAALANERVQCNAAGQVVLKLKTAWSTTPEPAAPLPERETMAFENPMHPSFLMQRAASAWCCCACTQTSPTTSTSCAKAATASSSYTRAA